MVFDKNGKSVLILDWYLAKMQKWPHFRMVFGKNGKSGLILRWYLAKMAKRQKWSHFRMICGKNGKMVSFFQLLYCNNNFRANSHCHNVCHNICLCPAVRNHTWIENNVEILKIFGNISLS